MSTSATYTRGSLPEWQGHGRTLAEVAASDYGEGSRALVAGTRLTVSGGEWVGGAAHASAISAAGYTPGTVLQLTAAGQPKAKPTRGRFAPEPDA